MEYKMIKKFKNIEKTLEYHELLMIRDLNNIENYNLPKGFKFVFWDNDACLQDWINIHIETGEFNSVDKEALPIFKCFYSGFYEELPLRCIFIENNKGEKIATATITPANEFGFKCVIDWFAISPKAQGFKLSKPLLSKVLITAKKMGYKKILLHTQTNTWLAAKIYLDCGFKPYKTKSDKGWNILKTITNHCKLEKFKSLSYDEMYDNLMVKIENELNKNHKNYNFSVWYINNRNDIYVREDNNFYEYKYFIENNNIKLIKQNSNA